MTTYYSKLMTSSRMHREREREREREIAMCRRSRSKTCVNVCLCARGYSNSPGREGQSEMV
jgi:hypothetical protein